MMTQPAVPLLGMACFSPLLAALPAEAALPPAYQRVRVIVAVAEAAAPRLRDPIETVRQVAAGRFEVQGGTCSIEVRIVPAPPKTEPGAQPAPGPLPFAATAGEATCR